MVYGLCYFFKIQLSGLPQYLNDPILKPSLHYITRFSLLPNFTVRTNILGIPFFIYLELVEKIRQYHKVI